MPHASHLFKNEKDNQDRMKNSITTPKIVDDKESNCNVQVDRMAMERYFSNKLTWIDRETSTSSTFDSSCHDSLDCSLRSDHGEKKDILDSSIRRGNVLFTFDHGSERSTSRPFQKNGNHVGSGFTEDCQGPAEGSRRLCAAPIDCETLKQLQSTLDLRKQEYGDQHVLVASAWNDIGHYYYDIQKYERALDAHQQASCCNPCIEVVWALVNMSSCALSIEKMDESIRYCEKALCVQGSLDLDDDNDERCNVAAAAHHQLGVTFLKKKQFARAMECLYQAVGVYHTIHDTNGAFVARVMDTRGRIHSELGESEAALREHTSALDIYNSLDTCDRAATQCLDDIAMIHVQQGEYGKSIKALTKKMQLHSRFLTEYQGDRNKQYLIPIEVTALVDTLLALGKVQEKRGYPRESHQCEANADFLHESLISFQEKKPIAI